MTAVPIRYTIYNWSPPPLTKVEEIALGREIVRVGRENFTRALKRRLSTPARPGEQTSFRIADIIHEAENPLPRAFPSAGLILVLFAFLAFCLGAIATVPGLLPRLLIAFVIIGPLTTGSLIWMNLKIDRWVQRVADSFFASLCEIQEERR